MSLCNQYIFGFTENIVAINKPNGIPMHGEYMLSPEIGVINSWLPPAL